MSGDGEARARLTLPRQNGTKPEVYDIVVVEEFRDKQNRERTMFHRAGQAFAASTNGDPGVYGSNSSSGYGVRGYATGNYAVHGATGSASYGGVIGYTANGSYYGILGHANAYALYGAGAAYVSGAISAGDSINAGTYFNGPYMYDSNNTSYYVDSASTSVMNAINAAGQVTVSGMLTAGGGFRIGSLPAVPTNYLCYVSAAYYGVGYCSSLRKFKENVQDLPMGLDEVMKLRPVTYTWIKSMGGYKDFGFIAEEAVEVNPLFGEYQNGKLSSVKYPQLTSLLTKAMQQLKGIVDGHGQDIAALKSENATLKARVDALEKRLDALEAK